MDHGSISVTSGDVTHTSSFSSTLIPRVTMAQSDNDVIKTSSTSSMMWAMPRMTSERGEERSGPSLPERIMTAPLPDITDNMLLNETDPPPIPLSQANRVLVKNNVAARHALRSQNEDLSRQFSRIMAAHAAQERLIQAELRAIQQHTLSPGGATTASAVDFSQVMSSHNISTSNGKYFVSPFNRHKVPSGKGDSPTAAAMSLPVAMGHSSTDGAADILAKYSLSSRPKMGKLGVKAVNTTPLSSGTGGMRVTQQQPIQSSPQHNSPALKLRQTATGGLKLQPVHPQQVNGAITDMKSKGGKPVRVKVQLKVKLPPLKAGNKSPMLPQPKYDPSQLQVKPSSSSSNVSSVKHRYRYEGSPGELQEESSFGALRKIDIIFAGERAAARSQSPGESDEGENKTLVLRCADGTLCRVPIGSTHKLQKLVANRDGVPDISTAKILRQSREGLTGKPLLRSCFKRPRSKMYPKVKKTVHFAPDVVDVSRENKETELQPTVKIGSKFYTIKLPNIKAVQRVPAPTDRYALKSLALLPKIPELLEDLKSDLDTIPDIEDGASVDEGEPQEGEARLDSASTQSSDAGDNRPTAAWKRQTPETGSSGKLPKYKDVVLQVRMKKKKTPTPSPSPDISAPPPSPESPTDKEQQGTSSKYMVSKVHDKWKVTIRNT